MDQSLCDLTPEEFASVVAGWFQGPCRTNIEIFRFTDTLVAEPTALQQHVICFFAGALHVYHRAVERRGREHEHNQEAVLFSKQLAEAVNAGQISSSWSLRTPSHHVRSAEEGERRE